MSNTYPDPEVEEGFRLIYGNNSNYPVSNAYSNPEYYRQYKRDYENKQKELFPETPKPKKPKTTLDYMMELKSYKDMQPSDSGDTQSNLQPQIRPIMPHFSPLNQSIDTVRDMAEEYFKMKKHNYVDLDDYHHCKANYNAAKRGPWGYKTAQHLGFAKEMFDYLNNVYYKKLSKPEAKEDFLHDNMINAIGRKRAQFGNYDSARDACADFRDRNSDFPERLW